MESSDAAFAFDVECIPWSNWEKSKIVPLSLFIILSRNFIFYHCTGNKGGS